MSNVLSSLWALICKIIGKIFKWIAKILGDWLLIILIIVLIVFAPEIAVFLAGAGAPGFVVEIFVQLSALTPYVTSALSWVYNSGSSLLSYAWKAYTALSPGMQAAIAVGAASLIAPEETAALVGDVADLISAGAGTLASAALSTPVGIALAAFGVWWFLFKDDDKEKGGYDGETGYVEG